MVVESVLQKFEPGFEKRAERLNAKVALSPRMIAALDAARGGAAVYVVLHHLALHYKPGGVLEIFEHFGHQAVILFFLLSGFVIYANERSRVLTDILGYAIRRLARIYPTLIIAMVASVCVAALNGSLDRYFSFASLPGTLFALQDRPETPGNIVEPFMDNAPLWSLAYEIWFYVLFPFALVMYRSLGDRGTLGIGLICAICYAAFTFQPNHFLLMTSYFAAWWFGAMLAEAYSQGGKSVLDAKMAAVSLGLVIAVAIVPAALGSGPRSEYPFLQVNHLASALLIGAVLFSPLGRALASLAFNFKVSAAAVASISYGLYVLHWPILLQFSVSRGLVPVLIGVVALLALSIFADRYMRIWLRRALKLKRYD